MSEKMLNEGHLCHLEDYGLASNNGVICNVR
jgi:hypothetical protein